MKPLSRRTFLRGTAAGAGIALALPALEAMLGRGARADDLVHPIFGLFFWANGLPWHAAHGAEHAATGYPDLWTPATVGPYTPTELLEPLAPYNVSVVTGLEPHSHVPEAPAGQSDGHMRGFMVGLTGDRIRPEGFDHPSHTLTALRPTLDQLLAGDEAFQGSTPPRFRSLVLGVDEARFHDYGHWNSISYNGPDSLNPPILDPNRLFDRLFGVSDDALALERRSRLLDAVLDDAHDLRAKLGHTDRARLDAHLEHIWEVQRQLELGAGTCTEPPRPGTSTDLLAKTRTMARLLATGLSCDLTRVFSFMLTSPASTRLFAAQGATTGMHSACHDGQWENVRRITAYQMECFAALLDELELQTDLTGGSVLDRCLVYGTSEYGEGWLHSVREIPVVLAGGANGALVRGQHVREAGGNICRAQLTALQALGLDYNSFGFNGGETSSPFSELLA